MYLIFDAHLFRFTEPRLKLSASARSKTNKKPGVSVLEPPVNDDRNELRQREMLLVKKSEYPLSIYSISRFFSGGLGSHGVSMHVCSRQQSYVVFEKYSPTLEMNS